MSGAESASYLSLLKINLVECFRNFRRLQAITVSGLTTAKVSFQADPCREIHDQRRRSAGVSHGRRPPRWRTSS